jgi:AAA family ATP:ADP antiporter
MLRQAIYPFGSGVWFCGLLINLFTLLGAYYLLKTVRESLILAEGRAEATAVGP